MGFSSFNSKSVRHPKILTQTFATAVATKAAASAIIAIIAAKVKATSEFVAHLPMVVVAPRARGPAISSRFGWGPNSGFAGCPGSLSCSRTTG